MKRPVKGLFPWRRRAGTPAFLNNMNALRLGHIDYLNCVPFFHYLRSSGFLGAIERGVPAQLNARLAQGVLDASPSSCFEYARDPERYVLLPGHSISAFGPVQSVLFFSPRPLSALENQRLYLTGESATSVNLLRVLLHEFYGWSQIDTEVPRQPVEDLLAQGKAGLLIGDRALRARRQGGVGICYDLAQLWVEHTGLPFVFALWIVRRDLMTRQLTALQQLSEQLHQARQHAFADLTYLARQYASEHDWIAPAELENYWRAMSYDLAEDHLAGLALFFTLCQRHGLLPHQVPLRFVPAADSVAQFS